MCESECVCVCVCVCQCARLAWVVVTQAQLDGETVVAQRSLTKSPLIISPVFVLAVRVREDNSYRDLVALIQFIALKLFTDFNECRTHYQDTRESLVP